MNKFFSYLLSVPLPCTLLSMCHPTGTTLFTHQRGPEDLTVFEQDSKRLLVAGTAPRRLFPKRGISHLETLDLDSPSQGFQVAYEARAHTEFHPVGLDCIPDPRNPQHTLLFAVNSRSKHKDGAKVNAFRLNGSKFEPSFSTAPNPHHLSAPNGLVVASNGTIYVTNMSTWPCPKNEPNTSQPINEKGDQAQLNTIVACRPIELNGDGVWRTVARGLDGANGLALSHDEKHLLVASYHRKTIHSFARNPSTGELSDPLPVAKVPFWVDNLKTIGPNRFTACGQTGNKLGLLSYMLFQTPTLPGAAIEFQWTPEDGFHKIHDYSAILKKDRYGPSTLILEGDEGYVGHIITRGVGHFNLSR